MTQDEKRIAIYTALGWRHIKWSHGNRPFSELIGRPSHVTDDDSWCDLPDTFGNLNECHYIERAFSIEQHSLFRDYLASNVDFDGLSLSGARNYVSATAAQRAEAIYQTLCANK